MTRDRTEHEQTSAFIERTVRSAGVTVDTTLVEAMGNQAGDQQPMHAFCPSENKRLYCGMAKKLGCQCFAKK